MKTKILILGVATMLLHVSASAEDSKSLSFEKNKILNEFKNRINTIKDESKNAFENIGNEDFKVNYKTPFGEELHAKLKSDEDYKYITALYIDLKNGINLDLTLDQEVYIDVYQKSNKLMMKYSDTNALKLFDFYKKSYDKYLVNFIPNDLNLEYVVKHPDKTKGVSLREHPLIEFNPKQVTFLNNYTHLHLKGKYEAKDGSTWGNVTILNGKDENKSGWVNLGYCEIHGKFYEQL
jgi:hypothetical protein